MKKNRRRGRSGRGASARSRPRLRNDVEGAEESFSREKIFRGRRNEGELAQEASQTELEGDVSRGQVMSIRGTDVWVAPEERVSTDDPTADWVVCQLRKSTRVPHRGASSLVVGDWVRYLVDAEEPHVLTEVEGRTSALTRTRRDAVQVIAANVEIGVVVSSIAEPAFKPRLVDRMIVSLRFGGVRPLLVLNKVDLASAEVVEAIVRSYDGLPVEVVATSTESGDGIDELREILRGRTSVLSGQSGVGKSSLLNALLPHLSLRTSEVYGKLGKGRHTTTASSLYPWPSGGGVIDTPGIRSFSLPSLDDDSIHEFFPEIAAEVGDCQFSDCSHRGDRGCALPGAVEAGRVAPERLESYLAIVDEIRSS